jgi:hypothetical protein
VTDLPPEVAETLEKLSSAPPHVRREGDMIRSLISEYPDAGNHLLYSLYRGAGGKVPWKVFRRVLSDLRSGQRGSPIATASEEMRERRRVKAIKEAEIKAEAKKRKAEERARKEKEAMATIRREDLRTGQNVFVRVRYGDQMKLRPAKINEVMRAAINLSIEGENLPRTVRFNEIELSADVSDKRPATAPTLTAVPPAFAALSEERRHPHVEVRRPSPPAAPPPPPAPPPPEPPADGLGQVNAWIEQGAAMRESLAKKQEALLGEMDVLALEALRIEEALTAKKAEMARVTAMLAAIDQIRGAAA